MRYSRKSISLRTFGLAFAVALSPALMQTDDLTCVMPKSGDTTLSALEIEGTNALGLWPEFTAETREYGLFVDAEGPIIVHAVPTDLGATVTFQVEDASGSLWGGYIGVGGGDQTVDVSDGTTLRVFVKAPEGASDVYEVLVAKSSMNM